MAIFISLSLISSFMSQPNTNVKNAFRWQLRTVNAYQGRSYEWNCRSYNGSGSPSTTPTGTASVPLAKYNATPTTRTEGQFGTLQEDTLGNLKTLSELLSLVKIFQTMYSK